MKKIVLLIFICFLTISAVNATNQTAVNATNQTDQTFTDLQTIIDNADENATIELDSDYSFDESKDSTITIHKAVTINGNNHVLDAKSKVGIMIIDSSKVTLNNIIFKNGNSYNGGAIFADSVIISNSEFDSNKAGYMGGAVFITGTFPITNAPNATDDLTMLSDAVRVNNCKFIKNNARYGGAIFAKNGIVENSKFKSNNAEYGGAIHAENYRPVRDHSKCISFHQALRITLEEVVERYIVREA